VEEIQQTFSYILKKRGGMNESPLLDGMHNKSIKFEVRRRTWKRSLLLHFDALAGRKNPREIPRFARNDKLRGVLRKPQRLARGIFRKLMVNLLSSTTTFEIGINRNDQGRKAG
jgi:hypothetical protein